MVQTLRITECDVLRYHYTLLAATSTALSISSEIETALINLIPSVVVGTEGKSTTAIRSGKKPAKRRKVETTPDPSTCSIIPTALGHSAINLRGTGLGQSLDNSAGIDPQLIELDLDRSVDELGQLAREVIMPAKESQGAFAQEQAGGPRKAARRAIGKKEVKSNGGKKKDGRVPLGDHVLITNKQDGISAAASEPQPTDHIIDTPHHVQNGSPMQTSTSPNTVAQPIEQSPPGAKSTKSTSKAKSQPKLKRPRSSIPTHLRTQLHQNLPLTPLSQHLRAGLPTHLAGIEIDELSTPLQPTLFGRVNTKMGTGLGAGRMSAGLVTEGGLGEVKAKKAGGGVGKRIGSVGGGPTWAISTPLPSSRPST